MNLNLRMKAFLPFMFKTYLDVSYWKENFPCFLLVLFHYL